jgi:hypothetical protein
MRKTRIFMQRRKQLADELARDPSDYVGMDAVMFSGVTVFPGDPDELGQRLATVTKKRRRWLLRLFPNEIWRTPLLTSMLVEETGRCYVYGAHYATIAMCQAVTESLLRRAEGGSEAKYYRLVDKLFKNGKLSLKQKGDLVWLASIRNPSLHTGSQQKYAKALTRALMPVISRGKLTERMPIELDCKRAIRAIVSLLHHLCVEQQRKLQ